MRKQGQSSTGVKIMTRGGSVRKNVVLALLLFVIAITPGFAEKVAVFTDFTNPYEFHVDKDHFYVSEGTTIYIYSLKDYTLIKKFGRKGEGPGEFLLGQAGNGLLLHLLQDHIMVNSYGRITYFTRDGEYIKEIPIKAVARLIFPFYDQFLGLKYIRDGKTLVHQMNIYNASFDLVKTIYRHEHGIQTGTGKKFNPLTINPPECKVYDNKIFMIDGQRDALHVFNQQGEPLFTVTNKDDLLDFTDKDREIVLNDPFWKNFPNYKTLLEFPAHYPPIHWFYIDPAKKIIYLKTYTMVGDKAVFLLFDFNGSFIKKTLLPFNKEGEFHLAFFDGKYYRLMENADEEVWELHIMTPVG